MILFEDWTEEELRYQIRSLELQIASGVQAASYSDGGSMQTISRTEALRTLRVLKQRLNELLGRSSDNVGKIKATRLIPVKGY